MTMTHDDWTDDERDDEMDLALRSLVSSAAPSADVRSAQRLALHELIAADAVDGARPPQATAPGLHWSSRWRVAAAAVLVVAGVVAVAATRSGDGDGEQQVVAQDDSAGASTTTPDTAAYTVVHAEVLPSDVGAPDQIEIDRGAAHGVVSGAPVVGQHGLLGTVVDVTESTSSVRLITSPRSSVPAAVTLTTADDSYLDDAQGTVTGQGPGQPLLFTVAGTSSAAPAVQVGAAVVADRDAADLAQPKVPIGRISRVPSGDPQPASWIFEVEAGATTDGLTTVDVLIVDLRRRSGNGTNG